MIYALLSRIFLLRFTHFFRRFFETEKQNPQTFILLECMGGTNGKQIRESCTWVMFEFGKGVNLLLQWLFGYLLLHLQARVTKWVADNISETLYSASGSSLQWNFICSCDANTPHICHWRHQDQKRKIVKCCHIQRKVLRAYVLLALQSARQCCDVPMDSQWRFFVYFNHNIDIGDIQQRWSLIKILLYLSIKTSKWPLETLILSFHLFKNWIRSEFNASMWCCPYMNQQQCAL